MFDSKPQIIREPEAIRVLHVDDESSFLDITRQILPDIDASLEVDSATSVDEAFSKISSKDYDVVVSDYEMPLKNGLDFLRELKAKDVNLPFILFTGRGREEIAIRFLKEGKQNLLLKRVKNAAKR